MNAARELLAKLAGRQVVASVSGGKDSAALSLHLREMGIEHDRVFLDTGWEHAATYDYLRGPLTAALGPITEVKAPRGMAELVRHKRMFPSRLKRFCTQELKVKPMQRYLRELVDGGADIVNAVGIRREESAARASSAEWEWSEGFDCEVWRPLVEWSTADVIAIHARHGLRPNPLYLVGATRVGCWPCVYARKAEVRLVADTDPARIDLLRTLEAELTERAGAPRAWFQSRVIDPATGHMPVLPIDEAVAWSRTSHGGTQFEMFGAQDSDVGCMRWGLCETGDNAAPPEREDSKP